MSYQQVIRDGSAIYKEVFTTDAAGIVLSTNWQSDWDGDGVPENRQQHDYTYDAAGRLATDHHQFDFGANWTIDVDQYRSLAYNADGTVAVDRTDMLDVDEDGLPDWSQVTEYTYGAVGLLSAETKHYYNGEQSMLDYRLETFTYTVDGDVDTHLTDDWAIQDFVVGTDYDYAAPGKVSEVYKMDEFSYGNADWHLVKQNTYDAAGRLATTNEKMVYSEWGQFSEMDTKLSYDGLNDSHVTALIEGYGHDGALETRVKHETWANADGNITRVLDSIDANHDGKFTPGSQSGYMDSRNITRNSYSDIDGDGVKELTYQSIDFGLDKILDYEMTITPMADAMLLA